MSLTYNRTEVRAGLENLPDDARVAFALSCAERLLPNYLAFRKETGWGSSHVLRRGLDVAWDQLSGSRDSLEQLRAVSTECESQAPDSEDFDSLYTGAAQDAVLALCSVFDYLTGPATIEKIEQASSYAVDSIDLYVQEVENMNPQDHKVEERIRLHPLMQTELEKQELAMVQLRPPADLSEFRARWSNPARGNLG